MCCSVARGLARCGWLLACHTVVAADATELVVEFNRPLDISLQVDQCGSHLLQLDQLGADVELTLKTATASVSADAPLQIWQPEVLTFEACPGDPLELRLTAKTARYLDGRVRLSSRPLNQPVGVALSFVAAGHQAFAAKDYTAAAAQYDAAASAYAGLGEAGAALLAAVSSALALEAGFGAAEAQQRLARVVLAVDQTTLAGFAWQFHSARLRGDLGDRRAALLTMLTLLDSPVVDNPLIAGWLLNNIGLQYAYLNEVDDARAYYDRVLALGDTIDESLRSLVLNNIGGTYFVKGQPQQARDAFQRMLEVQQRLDNLVGQAQALGNLIIVDMRTGEFGQALSMARKLLEMREQIGSRRGIALANTLLGAVLFRLGDSEAAAPLVKSSLRERLDLNLVRESMHSAMLQAEIAGKQGQGVYSAMLAGWALRRAAALEDDATMVRTLEALTNVLGGRQSGVRTPLGQWALNWLQGRAEELAGGDVAEHVEPDLQLLLANLARWAEQPDRALSKAMRAQQLAAAQVRPDLVLESGMLLASMTVDPGQRADRLQRSYDRALQLWRSVASPLHAHRYTDALREVMAARLALCSSNTATDCASRLLIEIDLLRRQAYGRFAQLQGSPANSELVRRRQELLREIKFRRAVNTDNGHIQRLLLELNTVDEQLAQRGNDEWAPVDLEVLRQRLEPAQLLVAHFIGERTLYRWRLTPKGMEFTALALPASPDRFRDLVLNRAPVAEIASVGSQWTTLLLGDQLDGIEEILVLPDAALANFPFAGLPVGDAKQPQWLIDEHSIVVLPHLAAKQLAWRKPRAILAVGDPDYLDPALALPYSGVEVARIEAVAKANAVTATVLRDSAVSIEGLARVRTKQPFDVLHLALHGTLNTGHPELSQLVFSDRGARQSVTFGDALLGQLDAPLVVLSACDSARGYPGSFGPLGLVQALQQTPGAPRVVASLWPVADAAGPALFSTFYQQLLGAGVQPEHALAAAQRVVARNRRFSHPVHWAGYANYSMLR